MMQALAAFEGGGGRHTAHVLGYGFFAEDGFRQKTAFDFDVCSRKELAARLAFFDVGAVSVGLR